MPVENATHIAGLVEANPAGSETISEGDDHIRLTKFCIRNTLPNFNTTVTITSAQLNDFPSQIASNAAAISALAVDLADDYTDLQAQLAAGDAATLVSAGINADAKDLVTLGNAQAYTNTREIAINAKIAADINTLKVNNVDPNTSNISAVTTTANNNNTAINQPTTGILARLTTIEGLIGSSNPSDPNYQAAVAYTNNAIANLTSTRIVPIETLNATQTTEINNLKARMTAAEAAISALQTGGGVSASTVTSMINAALSTLKNELFPLNTIVVGNALQTNAQGAAPSGKLPGVWDEIRGDYTFGTTNDGNTIVFDPAKGFGNFDNGAKLIRTYATQNTAESPAKWGVRQRFRLWARTG